MFIVEFERCYIDGRPHTAVRVLNADVHPRAPELLAETVYLGDPPCLHLEDGQDYTGLRLQPAK